MLVSLDSKTVSSPSKTAVGISTGCENLFAIISSYFTNVGFYASYVRSGIEESCTAMVGQPWGGLGGGEDLFVSRGPKRELMPTVAYEDGTPRIPILLMAEKYKLLPTLSTRKDALLRSMLHVYLLWVYGCGRQLHIFERRAQGERRFTSICLCFMRSFPWASALSKVKVYSVESIADWPGR
jgi:hypothetical protein